MRASTIFCLIAICLPEFAHADPPFVCQTGSFQIKSPVPLVEMKNTNPDSGGYTSHFYSGTLTDKAAFQVGYIDFPAGSLKNKDTSLIMQKMIENVVTGTNSKVVHEADLKLGDFPGSESMMQAMGPDGSMLNCTVRMYCRGDRIYEVMVSAAAGKISSDDIDLFLNSFQLLPVDP